MLSTSPLHKENNDFLPITIRRRPDLLNWH